jgi:hypothetical protein
MHSSRHSSFHTDVKEVEYKDLLTSTFTQTDTEGHEKLGSKDGYPQCVFWKHLYTIGNPIDKNLLSTINKNAY